MLFLYHCSYIKFPYGERLYIKHCADCHMDDGSGVAQLYPRLKKQSLNNEIERIPCLIRYGSNDSNSLIQMIPIENLSEVEITNILNYLLNDMNHFEKEVDINDTKSYLEACDQFKSPKG